MKHIMFLVMIVALLIDQIIKFICSLCLNNYVVIIPKVLSLVYAENKGVAFSMLSGNRMFVILISIILIFILINFIYKDYILKDKRCLFKEITFGFLLGGIFGNLIDRIVRGYVIDYVALNIFGYSFPIFNLADVLITVGVLLISVCYLKDNKSK